MFDISDKTYMPQSLRIYHVRNYLLCAAESKTKNKQTNKQKSIKKTVHRAKFHSLAAETR